MIIIYLKRILGVGAANLSDDEPEPESPLYPLDVLRIRSATPFTIFILKISHKIQYKQPILSKWIDQHTNNILPAHHHYIPN